MKYDHLDNMIKGWFVGALSPSVHSSEQFEVGVKHYSKGEFEGAHYHKVATEITVIVKGQVRMQNKIWKEGDILTIEPNEVTSFEALEDSTTVVVKVPGTLDDKYVV